MKKTIFIIFGLLLLLSGCSKSVSPVVNAVDLTKVDFSNAQSFKEVEACGTYIFGFIGPFGDPQVIRAIRDGNISKVYAVDYKSAFYLIFSQECVVVYGE